ncbi:MAG: alcohol dehydrogenase catalytic domain-containing protein [Caldilinea sp.]|nr:alcohol dehydrogenase catalytic domain-containing protein [Caldilineaceae bacterium]MCB9121045.1 alcohol dehydrogenase catalytic domain-containing protein [Caldilineaceae bacterium]MCW5839658.1 alcohol dehydrogenase catalytic domain-containing protein [Caldilinea sp.]HRW50685.1 alcohol dehydrogenase catalytic domain-containing protein [Caldilinea sp.]
MKAAVQTGVRQFAVREVADPALPEDGLILRVTACGVCGSDLRRWREGLPPGVEGIIPGHEIAGRVVAVGARVSHIAVGDRLALAPDIHCGHCWYCQREMFNLCDHMRMLGITPGYPGGFAEKLAISGEVLSNGVVHPVPDELPDELAALAEPCASVLASHLKTDTSFSDTVVVIGAGPIGCLLVATAKARGARAFIVVRSDRRRELVARFAPDAIIDSSREEMVARVRELTHGLGADIAICANPDASTQEAAVRMVRKGGKVVLFGGLPKASPMTTLDSNRIHYGEIEVVGAFSYHPTAHAMALDLFARGAIPVEKLITHRFALDAIDAAFATADSGEGLKVLVTP